MGTGEWFSEGGETEWSVKNHLEWIYLNKTKKYQVVMGRRGGGKMYYFLTLRLRDVEREIIDLNRLAEHFEKTKIKNQWCIM